MMWHAVAVKVAGMRGSSIRKAFKDPRKAVHKPSVNSKTQTTGHSTIHPGGVGIIG